MAERRDFTITKFGRHEDGYFHARVTVAGEKPVYLHRRFGSWMAPGKVGKQTVMKEPEALGIPHDAKLELARRARATERKERGDGETNGGDTDRGAESGDDVSGEADE